MKRNSLTVMAALAAVFFMGATLVEAAGVEFGGQLRPRFEVWEQGLGATGADFDGNTSPEKRITTRIRLNVKADINEDTSAFLQLQGIGTFGLGAGAGGRAATIPSDGIADVGFHQAYFTLTGFLRTPFDLKFGRQEIKLDGHRLVGSTNWTQGAQTHDAIRLDFPHENFNLMYSFSTVNETNACFGGAADPGDDCDIYFHAFHASLKFLEDFPFSLYFLALDNNSLGTGDTPSGTAAPVNSVSVANDIYTLGLRHEGKRVIDYRIEGYLQAGDAGGLNRSANMVGVRVGKTFDNVSAAPSVTLWYDRLSGTNDTDTLSGDVGAFHTLFDTGHKFYGFMDLFLPATGGNTAFLGLQDYALKLSVKPMGAMKIKLDLHSFWTAVDLAKNPVARGRVAAAAAARQLARGLPAVAAIPAGSAADDNHLGEEVDITVVYKYNPNTKIVLGYSRFFADDLFHATNPKSAGGVTALGVAASTSGDANWGYLMFDVAF